MPDWDSIVREHGAMAYQTAWRILGHVQDTEDSVQEALLETLRTYRKERVKNWGGLMRRAATRRALDRLRKRRDVSVLSANSPSPRDESPDLIAEARELEEWLRETLTQLSERQAEVFCLRYFSEMSNTEIAATLSITVDAVGVALYKARSRIAEEWNERDNAIRGKQR